MQLKICLANNFNLIKTLFSDPYMRTVMLSTDTVSKTYLQILVEAL